MNFDSEFGNDALQAPVWVPDFPIDSDLEQQYLDAGKLRDAGRLPNAGQFPEGVRPLGPDCVGGTMDELGITYRGDILEDVFSPREGLFTG